MDGRFLSGVFHSCIDHSRVDIWNGIGGSACWAAVRLRNVLLLQHYFLQGLCANYRLEFPGKKKNFIKHRLGGGFFAFVVPSGDWHA